MKKLPSFFFLVSSLILPLPVVAADKVVSPAMPNGQAADSAASGTDVKKTDAPSVQMIFDGHSSTSEQVKAQEKKMASLLASLLDLIKYQNLPEEDLLKLEREHQFRGGSNSLTGPTVDLTAAGAGEMDSKKARPEEGGEPYFILRKFPRSAFYLKSTDAKLRVEFAREYEEWLWDKEWSAIRQFFEEVVPVSAGRHLTGEEDLAPYGLALQLQADLKYGASLSVYKSFVGAPRRLAFASQFFRERNNSLKDPQLRLQAKNGSLSDDWLKQAVMDAAQLSYLARAAQLKAEPQAPGTQQELEASYNFENRQINLLLDHQLEQKIVSENLTAPLFPQVKMEKIH